jgi:putative ABC transport system substrate-binding protein
LCSSKRATTTIPIVFILVPDPVASGLVESLARPGGNITGFSTVAIDLTAKRLEIFKQEIAGLARVALLVNPSAPDIAKRTVEDTQRAAALLNLTIQPFEARSPDELERTFAAIRQSRVGGLVVAPDGMFYNERTRMAQRALAHRLPTIHPSGDTVHAGSLRSYGPNLEAICRRAPTYVDKIPKGAKPGDLPVEQTTKFDLVLNLKTAKTLGLTIPPSLLGRADEVIQ